MKNNNIVQSPDLSIDTLKCPKCGSVWRAQGQYEFGDTVWTYVGDAEYCPNRCLNLFGFRVTGKVIPRK